MDFVFGQDLVTRVQLQTTASAEIGAFGKSESYADFLNTAEWQGFDELRDDQDGLLGPNDFSVVSESGADWSVPAPEPAAGLALAAALALGALRLRRPLTPSSSVSRRSRG